MPIILEKTKDHIFSKVKGAGAGRAVMVGAAAAYPAGEAADPHAARHRACPVKVRADRAGCAADDCDRVGRLTRPAAALAHQGFLV